MRLALLGLAGVAWLAAACTREYHPEYHPQSTYSVSQTVSYPTTILEVGVAAPARYAPGAVEAQPDDTSKPTHHAPADPSRVTLLTASSDHGRPSEVIGVLDVRVSTDDREAAIAMVKQRAAEMGADAVTGLEFHTGRVSGLALRFSRP